MMEAEQAWPWTFLLRVHSPSRKPDGDEWDGKGQEGRTWDGRRVYAKRTRTCSDAEAEPYGERGRKCGQEGDEGGVEEPEVIGNALSSPQGQGGLAGKRADLWIWRRWWFGTFQSGFCSFLRVRSGNYLQGMADLVREEGKSEDSGGSPQPLLWRRAS